MKTLNPGVKLWTTGYNLLGEAKTLIDEGIFAYVELLINPDFLDKKPFLACKIPYVIHTTHDNFGVNLGNPSKKKYTLKMINESIMWADELDAKFIILHAGTGDAAASRDALLEISDERILLENMPVKGIYGDECLGYDVDSISKLMTIGDFGLCLDFGHAVKASISLKRNYTEVIDEFLELGPGMFHLSDGTLNEELDEHLNIGDGEYDFEYIKKCFEKTGVNSVTLETPRNNNDSLKEDIENVQILKTKLGVDTN